jgi:hypothetical protein
MESMPAAFEAARRFVEQIFGNKPRQVSSQQTLTVKQLWGALERTLGSRDSWRLSVLRELGGVLLAGAPKRRRSAEHERIFFQLLGYNLRPGFGYPLDEWRCEQCAHLFAQGVEFHKEKAIWNEFWILWRRIAPGLNEARHREIWERLRPHLALRVPPAASKALPRPKGVQLEGPDEMIRLAASLEHLEPIEKTEFGGWIEARLRSDERAGGALTWALGRLGARVPLVGSAHKSIPIEMASAWVKLLLEPEVFKLNGAPFALAQISRLTGDRARDLDLALRDRVLDALIVSKAPPSWRRMVAEVSELAAEDKARAFGDTLPVGLSVS